MQSSEIKREKNKIIEYIEKNLSEKRRIHTYGVAAEAVKLAKQYGEDPEKAELAALFHDIFRGHPAQVLNEYVLAAGLPPDLLDNCNLAHGKVAAIVMEKEFHVSDEDLLNAVRYHTTGRADMSLLEKIVYLADAIEPGRAYPGVETLRKLAYENLDEACLQCLENTIAYLAENSCHLDEDTVKAKDCLIKEKERKEKGL